MDRVRLGVLGAGNIAAMNVRGYLEDPRCDIVAVCDTDEEIGRQAAKEWGAESSYADLADHAGGRLHRRRRDPDARPTCTTTT